MQNIGWDLEHDHDHRPSWERHWNKARSHCQYVDVPYEIMKHLWRMADCHCWLPTAAALCTVDTYTQVTNTTSINLMFPICECACVCVHLWHLITSTCGSYLDLGAEAEAAKAEPKNIQAEASRISVEPKLHNVWARQSERRKFATHFLVNTAL